MEIKIGDKVKLLDVPHSRYKTQPGAVELAPNIHYGIIVKAMRSDTDQVLVDWYDKNCELLVTQWGVYVEGDNVECELFEDFNIEDIIINLDKLEKKYG